MNRNVTASVLIAVLGLALGLCGCGAVDHDADSRVAANASELPGSGVSSTPADPGTPTDNAAHSVDPQALIGTGLDSATTTLEADGWIVTSHDSRESRTILMTSNWVVTDATVAGDSVDLGAEKYSDSDSSANGDGTAAATDDEVVAAFQGFLDERAEAGVLMARGMTASFAGRVVTIIFDLAPSGLDQEAFDAMNPFDNLADFPGTVIAFDDDLGNHLRPAIDSVEVVSPDGTVLGARTVGELYKMGTGEDL